VPVLIHSESEERPGSSGLHAAGPPFCVDTSGWSQPTTVRPIRRTPSPTRTATKLRTCVADEGDDQLPPVEAGSVDTYDVFLSYAGEDREIAEELALALRDTGFNVWYDKFQLRAGDQFLARINEGLTNSRYGLLLISEAFLAKRWPGRNGCARPRPDRGAQGVVPDLARGRRRHRPRPSARLGRGRCAEYRTGGLRARGRAGGRHGRSGPHDRVRPRLTWTRCCASCADRANSPSGLGTEVRSRSGKRSFNSETSTTPCGWADECSLGTTFSTKPALPF
jgi:hypothetical protein